MNFVDSTASVNVSDIMLCVTWSTDCSPELCALWHTLVFMAVVWVIYGDIAGQVVIILCSVTSSIVECPNPNYDSNTIVNTQQVLYHYTATMQLTCATGYLFQQEQLVGLPLPINVECGFGGKWADFLEIPRCTRKWKSWIYLLLNFGEKTNRGLKKIGLDCGVVSLLNLNIEVYWKTVLWISGLNNKEVLVFRWSLMEVLMH